jgi:hypothetical protein
MKIKLIKSKNIVFPVFIKSWVRLLIVINLRKEYEPDGTVVFYGSGNAGDYGAFGCIITSLKEKSWFMDYVIKWIWYNSDDGVNEKDFAIEDVLYHYTKRVSVA